MKALSFILAAALTACGGGGGDTDESCIVAVWGDSIAVPLVEPLRATGYVVQDHAVSGTRAIYRTSEMLQTPVTANVVVLEFGKNDVNNTTASEHLARMEQMAQHAKSGRATVVITGISGTVDFVPKDHADFNAATRTMQGVVFADWDVLPYSSTDLPDGIHPAGDYRARLTASVVDRVRSICGK